MFPVFVLCLSCSTKWFRTSSRDQLAFYVLAFSTTDRNRLAKLNQQRDCQVYYRDKLPIVFVTTRVGNKSRPVRAPKHVPDHANWHDESIRCLRSSAGAACAETGGACKSTPIRSQWLCRHRHCRGRGFHIRPLVSSNFKRTKFSVVTTRHKFALASIRLSPSHW